MLRESYAIIIVRQHGALGSRAIFGLVSWAPRQTGQTNFRTQKIRLERLASGENIFEQREDALVRRTLPSRAVLRPALPSAWLARI